MAANEVANTILAQLGGGKFIAMTGSTNFIGSNNGLSFKVGSNGAKVTHVRVTLTPTDLYNVEFLSIRGTKVRPIAADEGLYHDQLRDAFTRRTGLHTSL